MINKRETVVLYLQLLGASILVIAFLGFGAYVDAKRETENCLNYGKVGWDSSLRQCYVMQGGHRVISPIR